MAVWSGGSGARWRMGACAARIAVLAVLLCLLLPQAIAAPLMPGAEGVGGAMSRPTEAVAYARIALVRVLTYYDGSVSGGAVPTQSPSPCASDGVLIGTTGSALNALNYVLTPTAAVSPTTPCAGAQAAFQQLYGRAQAWAISHIDVRFSVAYTGTPEPTCLTESPDAAAVDPNCNPSPFAVIDQSQIRTNGGANAPALQVLALTPTAGTPTHDLPVLSTPQPSDAPTEASGNVALDLTAIDGQLLGRDAVTPSEVATTLYPIDLAASTVGAVPANAATGGTPAPTAIPLDARLSVGAPVVDANGRLVGMVIANAAGGRSLASVSDITRAIGPVTSKAGALMMQWQQGLDAYYANPARYADAATIFGTMATSYPDFGGVQAFLTAARASSPAIPSLTTAPGSTGRSPGTTPGATGLGRQTLIVVVSLAFAALVLLIIATTVLIRRRRSRVPALRPVPPEEANLDLLPRDMPLDALDEALDLQQTVPLAALPSDVAAMTTAIMPAVAPEPLRRTRTGLALMPLAAGLTDAGVRRANDPNQDNIFVAQGIRLVRGRVQPYGLFIVADGMGGHLNGREASRLTIEIVGMAALRLLTSSNPVDDVLLTDLMRESVQGASAELRRRNLEERLDMGTTLTAALVVDDVAYVVNVGDSRTYLMSPELGLRAVTTDHSVVASLVAAGVIRPDDIYTHPRRNQIYRSLGGEADPVEVDVFSVPLQAGDKMLLCSDGLWEMVRDPQIEKILRGTVDPKQAAELLVREANGNGGEDNVSAVVVRFVEDVPQEAEAKVHILAAPESAEAPA